ncbi:class I SAM-dependent methyltransferase [Polaribacter glomeratus]|uniref:SAM-dependent methyltransferase n=1 Tax=Polaribacter glomeratus TaxID=102 RepID=A0A2S7WXJ0_9FLAO|nr:class I SAM-dependent methyltransferase [Polaribacter glomeratus]PQJ82324.1 SAM-dependent methyltransferase [Polaribacter glomeratus]TXD66915.1 class I SAM-dependent methyltransferase [Polaribacter glomeratus]
MAINKSDCEIKETALDFKKHWNEAYLNNKTEKLGWFEDKSEQTLTLINEAKLSKDALILNVGAGSSTLIDTLLADGFSNIIANDLSEEALESLKNRVGENDKVKFIVDDLLNPSKLNKIKNIDLWNDRAVLHFFLKEGEIKAYFKLLKKVLKANGFVVIAVFAKNGAEKCCGLSVKRYDIEMLKNELGTDFELKNSFNYTFVNPFGGERPYIYALFQRIN